VLSIPVKGVSPPWLQLGFFLFPRLRVRVPSSSFFSPPVPVLLFPACSPGIFVEAPFTFCCRQPPPLTALPGSFPPKNNTQQMPFLRLLLTFISSVQNVWIVHQVRHVHGDLTLPFNPLRPPYELIDSFQAVDLFFRADRLDCPLCLLLAKFVPIFFMVLVSRRIFFP